MERKQLEDLGLEKETINAVMAIHGNTIAALKAENTNLTTEKVQLEERIDKYEGQLDKLKSENTNSELEEQINSLQQENADLKADKEQELADLKKKHAIEMFVKGSGTKDEEYVNAKLQDLELDEEGNLKDADQRLEEIKEKHPLLFEDTQRVKKRETIGGNPNTATEYTSKEQIMAIQNSSERQKAILENKHLF